MGYRFYEFWFLPEKVYSSNFAPNNFCTKIWTDNPKASDLAWTSANVWKVSVGFNIVTELNRMCYPLFSNNFSKILICDHNYKIRISKKKYISCLILSCVDRTAASLSRPITSQIARIIFLVISWFFMISSRIWATENDEYEFLDNPILAKIQSPKFVFGNWNE